MNNNQFKKLIRKTIEEVASVEELQCVYVDISNNGRDIYVYDRFWNIAGTIHLWLNDDYASLEVSYSTEKKVSICNKDTFLKANYMKLDQIMDFIERVIHEMKKRHNKRNEECQNLEDGQS